jgi:hypothetical protein
MTPFDRGDFYDAELRRLDDHFRAASKPSLENSGEARLIAETGLDSRPLRCTAYTPSLGSKCA